MEIDDKIARVGVDAAQPWMLTASGKKLVFGLPGNTVSALISFHMLVQPALLKMMGLASVSSGIFEGELTKDIRKKAGRAEFVRAVASPEGGRLSVQPTVGQGSHMLGGLAQANCVIHVPAEVESIPKGQSVRIQFISWSGL